MAVSFIEKLINRKIEEAVTRICRRLCNDDETCFRECKNELGKGLLGG